MTLKDIHGTPTCECFKTGNEQYREMRTNGMLAVASEVFDTFFMNVKMHGVCEHARQLPAGMCLAGLATIVHMGNMHPDENKLKKWNDMTHAQQCAEIIPVMEEIRRTAEEFLLARAEEHPLTTMRMEGNA